MSAFTAVLAVLAVWGPCPGEDLRPSINNLPEAKAAVLCLVNEARRAHGARPLREVRLLEGAATRHSRELASTGRCDHGPNWAVQIRSSGYGRRATALLLAENVECATLMLATPRNAVAGWLASPLHRANLLGPDFRDSGIGVVPTFTFGQWGADYTQVLGAWR